MAETQLGPTAQKILEYLKDNRGTAFTADDICEVVDCATTQARTALETLANAGFIERQQGVAGGVTYLIRR